MSDTDENDDMDHHDPQHQPNKWFKESNTSKRSCNPDPLQEIERLNLIIEEMRQNYTTTLDQLKFHYDQQIEQLSRQNNSLKLELTKLNTNHMEDDEEADLFGFPPLPLDQPPVTQRETEKRNNVDNTIKANVESDPSAKVTHPPAIVVSRLNVSSFIRHMKEKQIDVSISNSKSNSTIKIKNEAHFERVKTYLHEHKYEFHSFTPSNERKTLLQLKGIHGSNEVEDVKSALIDEFSLKGISIDKEEMTVRLFKKGNDEYQNSIFIIGVSNKSPINLMLKINYLLGQRVYWQRFHNKDVAQCKKCQQFLHAAHNCERKFRCVKCLNDHKPGECARQDPKEGKPQCVNCKGEHPANYKGCPAFKDVLKIKKQKLEQQKLNRQQLTQTFERNINSVNGKSYAQTTRSQINRKPVNGSSSNKEKSNSTMIDPQTKNNVNDFVNGMPNSLFGCNLSDLLNEINGLRSEILKTVNQQEQQVIYLNFLARLCVQQSN